MRADHNLQPFHSAGVYAIADLVATNVRGGGDFDEDFSCVFGHPEKLFKPSKDSLLHDVIREIDRFYLEYSVYKGTDETGQSYADELVYFGLAVPEWLTDGKTDLIERRTDIYNLMTEVAERRIPSIFYLLFSDRDFLTAFAERVSDYIETLDPAEHPRLKDGRVPRPSHIPTWLKSAIFYRDRGRCQHCWKDLSGLNRPISDLQLDHIIPLASGGSNDPTNFQLACAPCNQSKGKQKLNTLPRFAPYW